MGRLVHADVLAARALVQLRLIPLERARLLLGELEREDAGPDLLEGLALDGSLPREHTRKVRQRVALYERVWLEDFFLRRLQRRCLYLAGRFARHAPRWEVVLWLRQLVACVEAKAHDEPAV